MTLSGRTVIVTGGNRGIGFDVCRKLAHAGNNVILCSRSLEAGREACEKINSTLRSAAGTCEASELDTSNPQSVQQFITAIGSKHSEQLYALINNAGIYPSGWTRDIFDTAMATNFNGPIALAQGLAPHMQEGGRIVNVTSGLAQLSHLNGSHRSRVEGASSLQDLQSIHFDPDNSAASFQPTYCLTKAMLNRASQILSRAPAFSHLSINSADPGWVRTEMGGSSAPRSIDQGSDSILATLYLPPSETGGFFFDGKPKAF